MNRLHLKVLQVGVFECFCYREGSSMRYGLSTYVLLGILLCGNYIFVQFELSDNHSLDFFVTYQQHINAAKEALHGLTIEPIEFLVQQGNGSLQTFNRKGFLALRPQALGTVIICHGYTHSKHEAFYFKTLFSHFNVLAFDFRAHGELVDKDQFSTIGRDEIYDVLGAVQFVRSYAQLQNKPIIGFGFSMGAVALLQAQAEFLNLFELLILDSPFDSSSDCMEQNFDKMLTYRLFGKEHQLPGKKLIMKMLYSERMRPIVKPFFKWASGMDPNMVPTKFVPVIPLANAAKITIPCFFISCGADKSVGVDSVRRLYESVQSPFKRFWIANGRKHCDSYLANPELYVYKVNKFIKKALEQDFKAPAKVRDDRVTVQAVKV